MAKKKAAAPVAESQVSESTAAATETAEPKADKLKHERKLAVVGKYDDASKITWNISSNPRAVGKGTFERFAAYFGTDTVGAYTAAGGTKGDLLWDLRSGYLSIEGVSLSGDPADRPVRAAKGEGKPKAKKAAAEPAPKVAEEEVQTETID